MQTSHEKIKVALPAMMDPLERYTIIYNGKREVKVNCDIPINYDDPEDPTHTFARTEFLQISKQVCFSKHEIVLGS